MFGHTVERDAAHRFGGQRLSLLAIAVVDDVGAAERQGYLTDNPRKAALLGDPADPRTASATPTS